MIAAQASPGRRQVPETELPDRYQTPWLPSFVARALDHSHPGMTIVDLGGGDKPTLAPELRPAEVTYIGLDPDADDLARGDYDIRIVAGASDRQADLIDTVDLILAWNVLEHVPDIPDALATLQRYLKPGGVLLARFAARWAVFAVGSRVIPHDLRVRLMSTLIDERVEDHFPTHYDHCQARDFELMLSSWSEHEVIPYYRGAGYFAFSRVLQRAYLAYEALAMRTPALATHYEIRAVR